MLELNYKKISENAKDAMANAVGVDHDYYNDATEVIGKYYPGDIHILNSANSCIITTVEAVEDPILTVDMGGWNGLERSAKVLNKKVEKITTTNGIINIKDFEDYFKENTINTLYITALAAYMKAQPIKEIKHLCDVYDVLLIVDISGVVGDIELCSCNDADILISSTGKPKIVNIENGGFIVNMKPDTIKLNNHMLKTLKADNITCAGINAEFSKAGAILEETRKYNNYLKEQLNEKLECSGEFSIIEPDAVYGINTIISMPSKSIAKKVAYNIRQQITVDRNKGIITPGPNYNRLKKPCVCIEIKNLDVDSITNKKLDQLVDIIIDSIKKEKEN